MGFELKGLGTLWVCLGFFLWVGFGTSCVLKGVLNILIKLFLIIKKKKKKTSHNFYYGSPDRWGKQLLWSGIVFKICFSFQKSNGI